LADIRDNGVSVEECQQGARTALLLHAMGADTYTGQAESLAFYEAIDSYELAISYEDEVLTIGPDDIRRVVLRYFDPDRALVVIGGGAP
jgi:predicted Zn-dependent peptidase